MPWNLSARIRRESPKDITLNVASKSYYLTSGSKVTTVKSSIYVDVLRSVMVSWKINESGKYNKLLYNRGTINYT